MITLIAGIQYGDEGKGSMSDYLSGEDSLVVRYNGGPQTAHHVITPEGVSHCFSQFGSNTLRRGSRTFISRYMLVNPLNILAEDEALKAIGINDALSRLYIDEDSIVVTPFNVLYNRISEIANSHKKGSCGMGVGDTVHDYEEDKLQVIYVKDLLDSRVLTRKVQHLWRKKREQAEDIIERCGQTDTLQEQFARFDQPDYVNRLIYEYLQFAQTSGVHIVGTFFYPTNEQQNIVFEGAQGILLDRSFGFIPHVTQTNTTFKNADELLQTSSSTQVRRIGIARAYTTRHGAGPFPTMAENLTEKIPDTNNPHNNWQKGLRVGWFDLVAARYSLNLPSVSIDSLAITNIDRLIGLPQVKVCVGYTTLEHPANMEVGFEYEKQGNQFLITAIKTDYLEDGKKQLFNNVFERCTPVYTTLPGWNSISDPHMHEYLQYLEKNLHTPISHLSTGPTRDDKQIY